MAGLQGAQALTYDELQGLTYLQVKGSGIANTCPVLEGGSSNLKDLKAGNYSISKFCLEPTSFTVKEESQFKTGEPEFVKTKLMTRLTYTLDEVRRWHARQLLSLCSGGACMHERSCRAVADMHFCSCARRSAASSAWTAPATWTSRSRTASTMRP